MDINLTIVSNVPVHLHLGHQHFDAVLHQLDDIRAALAALAPLTQQLGPLMTAFTDLDAVIVKYMADRDAVDATKDAAVAAAVQAMNDAAAQAAAAIAADTADKATIDTLNAALADAQQQLADATAQAQADIAKLTPPGVGGGDTTGTTDTTTTP